MIRIFAVISATVLCFTSIYGQSDNTEVEDLLKISVADDLHPEADEPMIDAEAYTGDKADNLLKNPSFERNAGPRGWHFRCADQFVYADPKKAYHGVQYLAANDGRGETKAPSVMTGIGPTGSGKHRVVFGIHIKSAKDVPGRKVKLRLWQIANNPDGPQWVKLADTKPMRVTTEWQEYFISTDEAGGNSIRCEVYWYDNSGPDLHFDAAYAYRLPL